MYDSVLDTFICVVENGSFTKAAKQLFISAPAVQKQINHLEEKIGVPLLSRKKSGIQLTRAGDFFYYKALSIRKESEKALAETRLIGQSMHTNNDIKIGTSFMFSTHLMSSWIQELPQHNVSNKVKLVPISPFISNFNELLKLFKNDTINCVCITKDVEINNPLLDFYYLDDTQICLAVPISNLLAQYHTISYTALENQTLVMMHQGYNEKLDKIRADIEELNIPLTIIDSNSWYTPVLFNECVQNNYLLLTCDKWANAHPNMKTVYFEKKYFLEYGVLIKKNI